MMFCNAISLVNMAICTKESYVYIAYMTLWVLFQSKNFREACGVCGYTAQNNLEVNTCIKMRN